jgi:hypothetical protein
MLEHEGKFKNYIANLCKGCLASKVNHLGCLLVCEKESGLVLILKSEALAHVRSPDSKHGSNF